MKTEKTFYTYFHTRNDTNAVFYVGKGYGDRAHSVKNRNKHWRHIVAKHGRTVHIAAQWSAESEALQHEKFLILCFKDLHIPLCNMTDGGEGVSGLKHTIETKEKLRAASLGQSHSDETRAKISLSSRGRIPTEAAMEHYRLAAIARTGVYKHSNETREKLRTSHLGKTLPAEQRAKIGLASTGRRHSDESREKIRVANLGKTKTDETKAKISATGLGRKHTDEAKAKISAASIATAKRKREEKSSQS